VGESRPGRFSGHACLKIKTKKQHRDERKTITFAEAQSIKRLSLIGAGHWGDGQQHE
jgi:hypothetical protein